MGWTDRWDDPFNPNATGIDHISYLLDQNQEQLWYQCLDNTIVKPPEMRWAKPHITLAYSVDPIQDFPNIGWDNSETYYLSPNDAITISNENQPHTKRFVDPMGHHHVIIDLGIAGTMYQLHEHYLRLGATWDQSRMGPYKPFIFAIKDIPLNMDYQEQPISFVDAQGMGIIWSFNMIRFSRFSEDRTVE